MYLPRDEPDVTGGSQALRPAAVVVEFFGHPFRRLRQTVRPLHVDPRQPHDTGVQPFDDGRLPELVVPAKKARARPRGAEFRQLIDQLVLPVLPGSSWPS